MVEVVMMTMVMAVGVMILAGCAPGPVRRCFTERSLRDLPTQLRFEADTKMPASPRPWIVDPRFGEWTIGLPEDWTRLGAPPRKRRGRPPAITRGGARPHQTARSPVVNHNFVR